MNSIKRITKTSWKDYINYFKKKYPIDIWKFSFKDIEGRIENNWKHGAKLFINGVEVDANKNLLAVKGDKPLLSFTDEKTTVGVYVKALLYVKVKVEINGEILNDTFI